MTNQDILEGKMKQVEGKVEDAYGDLTDSPEHDARGKAKQAEGLAQEGVGHVKEAIQDAVKNADVRDEQTAGRA